MAERHHYRVTSVTPPTVEWDVEAVAIYVRFSRRSVARTMDQTTNKMNITVDLDADGQVIGIEAIGMTRFSLRRVLEAAGVTAPNMDLANAEFVSLATV